MNGLCEVCKHHWWDKTRRRDVSWAFAAARSRLAGDEQAKVELDLLERKCGKLAETHICTYDGIDDVLEPGDTECEWWEAVA